MDDPKIRFIAYVKQPELPEYTLLCEEFKPHRIITLHPDASMLSDPRSTLDQVLSRTDPVFRTSKVESRNYTFSKGTDKDTKNAMQIGDSDVIVGRAAFGGATVRQYKWYELLHITLNCKSPIMLRRTHVDGKVLYAGLSGFSLCEDTYRLGSLSYQDGNVVLTTNESTPQLKLTRVDGRLERLIEFRGGRMRQSVTQAMGAEGQGEFRQGSKIILAPGWTLHVPQMESDALSMVYKDLKYLP